MRIWLRRSSRLAPVVLLLSALAWSSASATPSIQVTITGGPSGTVDTGDAAFTFQVNESGASLECSLDNAALAPCASPQTFSGLPDGDHRFLVKATDRERRNSDTDERRWTVSRPPPTASAPPDTAIVNGPSGITSATGGSFAFTSDQPVATFECSLDGAAFAACSSPLAIGPLGEGSHLFAVRAVAGGQVDPTPASRSWMIRRVVTPQPPSRSLGKLPDRLPIYRVVGKGVTPKQADALARALGISPTGLRKPDGSLGFLDDARFQSLPSVMVDPQAPPDEDGTPTVIERADFAAINRLRPLSPERARSRVLGALRTAGIAPPPGAPKVDNSEFVAIGSNGRTLAKAKVDTSVDFPFKLGGVPLVGPGAQAEFTFDPQGKLTRLRHAARQLTKGETVELLGAKQADALATRVYKASCAGKGNVSSLRLDRRVVYLAPSLEMGRVKTIVPHYDYGGTAIVAGQSVDLERVLLPAVKRGGPRAQLTASASGPRITAKTTVKGGTGPFTFSYESCKTTLSPQQAAGGPSLSYEVSSRAAGDVNGDTLSVVVTDANGLMSLARTDVKVASGPVARPRLGARVAVGGSKDVATEWIGNSQGLPNTQTNAYDFVDEMGDIATIRFNWGDNDVFESDYVDPSLGGDDLNWIDNADLIYHHGHGNPNGVTTGATSGDGFVDYSQTRWGGNGGDLEWMAMKACQVLKTTNGDGLNLDQRWISNAFKGLHMMLGMVTNGYNTTGFGNEFGDNMADDDMRIRSAWVDAAESDQPDGVKYRYMGVYGPGGSWNRNDYFPGIGSVSKDITTLTGYWYYTGTV
jgi:hypothetical protein